MAGIDLLHLLSSRIITGNLAIDAALVILCLVVTKNILGKIAGNVQRMTRTRSRTRKLTSEISASNEKLAHLRKELASARRNTHDALVPYLDDLDNRRKVAAAAADGERDSQFSDLEAQLTRAAAKSRHTDQH